MRKLIGAPMLLTLLLSGPQATLLLAAFDHGGRPLACTSRDCCCGTHGKEARGCRMAPIRCDPAAPFVLTAAEGILPVAEARTVSASATDPVTPAPAQAVADGHARRLDRPPRPS